MGSKNNQVNLNIDELKGFVRHIVNNNRHLQAQGKNPVAVEVVGESGIGKTSSILQLANELSVNMVKLNLAQIEELGDLVGFPVRQFQLCKEGSVVKPAAVKSVKTETRMVKKLVPQEITRVEKQMVEEFDVTETKKQVLEGGRFVTKVIETKVPKMVEKDVEVTVTEMVEIEVEETVAIGEEVESVNVESNGECIWADEQAVEEYLKRGYQFTGQKRMSYCPPEWIADKQGGGFLILDDWNRADIRFIQAVMELVDRQEYISWKLPQDWHIILTANPDNGEYLVQSIDNAQRTRFISVNLKYDIDVWARWAESAQIDSRCINFMLMHPELMDESASGINARSVTNFFNSISSIQEFEKELPLIQMIGEGSVGPEFTTMFTTFIHGRFDKLIDPKTVLTHDNEAYVIGELRSCIGRDGAYRPDIASIMGRRISNYSLTFAEKNAIETKHIDRLVRLVTDEETFMNDIKYVMVKQLINGNKQKFQKMLTNPEVIKMATK